MDRIYGALQVDFHCSEIWWWRAVYTIVLRIDVGILNNPSVREHKVQPVVTGKECFLERACDFLVVDQISSVIGCVRKRVCGPFALVVFDVD